MTRIEIPLDDLKDTLTMLQDIRDRISNTASLESVGTGSDVGDSSLSDAISSFDDAWSGGHERVQENVDTFHDAAQGVIDNFQKTDDEISQSLET